MRALKAFAASAAGAGVLAGAAARSGATESPSARATAALFIVFGLSSCLAAVVNGPTSSLRGRFTIAGLVAALGFGAAWIASAAAGQPSAAGACAVVAGAAVLACGAASLVRSLGVGRAHATFAGAAVPCALAALVFVADPFVEWRGSQTAEAPARAAAVIRVSPLAAIASGADADWQHSHWMYYGDRAGSPGLSKTGYYPTLPSSPWTWAFAAAAIGLAAHAATRRRSMLSP